MLVWHMPLMQEQDRRIQPTEPHMMGVRCPEDPAAACWCGSQSQPPERWC